MAYRKLQIRRGIKANLPILSPGEFGFCTDSAELFIGSGVKNHQIMDYTSMKAQTASKKKSYSVTIPAVGWSSVAPFTQTVSVADMVSDGLPLYDLSEVTQAGIEDFAKITKLETFNGSIKVTAMTDKPITNLKIRIEVVY